MGKIALITGATSGLGFSYAKYFASKGHDLIITGRREEVIRKNADDLKKQYNVNVVVIIVELSSISHQTVRLRSCLTMCCIRQQSFLY